MCMHAAGQICGMSVQELKDDLHMSNLQAKRLYLNILDDDDGVEEAKSPCVSEL